MGLLVIPALLLVMACGGDDDEATEAAPVATTPAPGTTSEATTPATTPAPGTTSEATRDEPEDTPVPADPENPLVIGSMDALTGVAESYGIPLQQAKLLAVEEINAAGGINGRELRIIFEDSKCAAQDAITAYNKLTDVDGVKIILGTTCSGSMLGAAPLAEQEGVVMLSASATSPDIASAGGYIFRTAINDLQLGVDTGNTMWGDGVREVATITESTDYAEGARRTSVAQFEKLGGTVVAAEGYSSDTLDFRTQLTKLINAEPDAILLSAQGEVSGGTIIKQARELSYLGPIYSEIVPTAPDALSIAADAATGLKAIVPNPNLNTSAGKDFLEAYRERYGAVAPLPWFMGSAYDDVYIAAECLGQTGDDQNADAFRDCLNDLTFSGSIGDDYSFDENGDVAGLTNVVIEVLPLGERTDENLGYVVLGPAPSETAAMAAAAGEPFVIGVMESITGPGETYGNVAVQAKQMAVEEINASGGINGRELQLIVEDSKCAAQDSITAYNKLTDVDGVKIILGTSCSGAMLGAAPLAEADGVVLFSGLATNPDIANAGDFIFRTAMSDQKLGIDTGNVLWADGARTVATITEATDYAEGVRRTTVAQFESLGGTVAAEERYASDIVDFRSQLTKLVNANPDSIHIAAQSEFTGGTIIKQLNELGYDGPIYSEIVPVGATALEIAGDAATGVKAILADIDPANAKGQEVLANFRERYDYLTLAWYLGSAYDDVYITAECLRRINDDQNAAAFRDCLYSIEWSGAIGDNYSFDESGEVVGLSNVVIEVLPEADRTDDNQGYRVLGPAPTQ